MIPRRISLGWLVGWITMLALWVLKDYQGGPEIIGIPIAVGIVSLIFCGVSHVLGLFLCGPAWNHLGRKVILFSIVGWACLFFADRLGLTYTFADEEMERPRQVMHTPPALLAYLLVIFPFVNWPRHPHPIAQ